MELKKSRKLLCLIMSIIMAFGAIASVATVVFRCTMFNSGFMISRLSSGRIITECDESYNKQMETLSKECGVPSRVMIAAKDKFIITETAAQQLFAGADSSMYSNDKIEETEKLCIEYLEGNGQSYDEEDIHRVAEKATQIYSSCYGITNAQAFYEFFCFAKEKSAGIVSSGLLLIMISVLVAVVLYSKKEKRIAQILSLFTTAGASLILFSVACLVFGIGTKPLVSPQPYASILSSVIRLDFAVIAVIGIAICTVSVVLAVKTNTKLIEKRIRDNI